MIITATTMLYYVGETKIETEIVLRTAVKCQTSIKFTAKISLINQRLKVLEKCYENIYA